MLGPSWVGLRARWQLQRYLCRAPSGSFLAAFSPQQSASPWLRSYSTTYEEILSPSLLQQLETLAVRHTAVTKELENPHISVAALTALSKEAAELGPVVEALAAFQDTKAAIASASAVSEDDSEDAGVVRDTVGYSSTCHQM